MLKYYIFKKIKKNENKKPKENLLDNVDEQSQETFWSGLKQLTNW